MKTQKKWFCDFMLWGLFLLSTPCMVHAQTESLKPGDTIGPHNWERVKDMVAPNFLERIKRGYNFQIKEPTEYQLPREYVEATKKYAGRVRLGPNGELLHHVAGLPFPKIDPGDPQAGLKSAWNFYWTWRGDDAKDGGAIQAGKVFLYAIEKDGSERATDIISYFLFPRTRVTLDPKPLIPGYEHIDRIQLFVYTYPWDVSGTATLEIRYNDPKKPDDLYLYIPSIRRIRRATTTQRCQTIAPSEFNLDDIGFFGGKITDFTYKLLGEKKILTNFSQEHVPYDRKKGDYLPLNEKWEVKDVYVLEITPKDPNYCYPRKILWLDKVAWEVTWAMAWDRKGEYWKEMNSFRAAARLSDGQLVWTITNDYLTNVQNGRTTLITASRVYNQGYPPSLFSQATMLRIMRGGGVE